MPESTPPDQAKPISNSSALDSIGPHDRESPSHSGTIESGGTEGTPPVNLDDDEIYSGRSKAIRAGGTANAKGGDSGRVGPPKEQLSNTNGPSDPDTRRGVP